MEDAETLAEFILSALDDGYEDEPEETVADLYELLTSASESKEETVSEVVSAITRRYGRYKRGETMSPVPAAPDSAADDAGGGGGGGGGCRCGEVLEQEVRQ